MWTRTLRVVRPGHRKAVFSRSYNGQSQTAHKTYFQTPPEQPKPPRRILRTLLLGTSFLALGAYGHAWLTDMPFLGIGLEDEDREVAEEKLLGVMAGALQDSAARNVPIVDMATAQEFLEVRGSYSVSPRALGHGCQLPSNMPCEDTERSGIYTFQDDPAKDWTEWTICDGHAGPRTAQILTEFLPLIVGDHLARANCLDRPYTPNDSHIIQTIKKAFLFADEEIIKKAADRVRSGQGDLSETISLIAPALSGSCALMALFDPAQSILRVANVGDSRAVLGRWDQDGGRYVANPMSVDQTGFNQNEVERLRQEHPGEESVDPKTGRVHGIAVSRAFGDSRWKWPQELSQLVREKFWGPRPRPAGMIKTPPYLTAEPEVIETKLQTGKHPDFLIMASDGLWDLMSSEDAVTCVEQWLDKFNPSQFLDKQRSVQTVVGILGQRIKESDARTFTRMKDMPQDEDVYFDEEEGITKWRVSSKHFVVEDENCGVHLIKNALGGKRRNLYRGLMSVQPPLSRDVRDDITVYVIFFGDFQQAIAN